MPRQVYFENQLVVACGTGANVNSLKARISQQFGVPVEDLYATIDGKLSSGDVLLDDTENVVRFIVRLVGGKGGFGSMLRAIGAQIEKTTNREACRDLSGRRLRDINEEKRLRKWLDGQSDRDREAAERKQKKLERLIAEPKMDVKFKDPVYEKERQALPERVSAAVDAGWEASGSGAVKRKADEEKKPKKKSKLWIDADLSDCSSSVSEDEDDDAKEKEVKSSPVPTASTDSGNDSDPTSASGKV